MFQQILVALIGFLRRREAGKLTHGVKLAAISSGVNAARKRRLPGIAEIFLVIPIFGEISFGIQPADWNTGNRSEARATVLVDIHAGGRANRLFRGLLQRREQRLLSPTLFGVRRVAGFVDL